MTSNGDLSSSELAQVSGQSLAPATASRFKALQAAAAKAGHTITIWQPAGGYRSIAVQRDMHAHPERYNIKPGISLAAVGRSTHGQGRAVDVRAATVKGRNWVAEHANEFGFSRPKPSADPDHYEFGNPMVTEPATPIPTPPSVEDEDEPMPDIRYHYKPASSESAEEYGIFGLDPMLPGGYKVSTDKADGVAWGRLHGKANGAPYSDTSTRTEWLKLQTRARADYDAWKTQQASPSDPAGVLRAIAGIPAAVIEEMKKPGN